MNRYKIYRSILLVLLSIAFNLHTFAGKSFYDCNIRLVRVKFNNNQNLNFLNLGTLNIQAGNVSINNSQNSIYTDLNYSKVIPVNRRSEYIPLYYPYISNNKIYSKQICNIESSIQNTLQIKGTFGVGNLPFLVRDFQINIDLSSNLNGVQQNVVADNNGLYKIFYTTSILNYTNDLSTINPVTNLCNTGKIRLRSHSSLQDMNLINRYTVKFEWTKQGNSTILSTNNFLDVSEQGIYILSAKIYKISNRQLVNVCTLTDDIIVTGGMSNTNVDLGGPITKCENETKIISTGLTQSNSTGQHYDIKWWYKPLTGLPIQLSSYNNQTSISVLNAGTYSVEVINGGCTYRDEVIVYNNPIPHPAFSPPGPLYLNMGDQEFLMPTGGPYYSSHWTPTNETSDFIIADQAGNYKVEVTNQYGCKNSASIKLNLNPDGVSKLYDGIGGEAYTKRINLADLQLPVSQPNPNSLEIKNLVEYGNSLDIVQYATAVKLNYHRNNQSDILDKQRQYNKIYVRYSLSSPNGNYNNGGYGELIISLNKEEPIYQSLNLYQGYKQIKLEITDAGVIDGNGNYISSIDVISPEDVNDINIELEQRVNYLPHISINTQVDGLQGVFDQTAYRYLFSWLPQHGAYQYELQLAFRDQKNDNFNSTLSTEDINQLFIDKGFSVTTNNTYYNLDMTYPKGQLYWRVRAIGRYNREANAPIATATWSTSNIINITDGGTSPNAMPFTPNMSWEKTVTFAEDGKKKEIVKFYDNTLRNKQVVTNLNTEGLSIYAENMYDNEGRPTVNILPVPLKDDQGLTYKENLNQNANGDKYSKMDFDEGTQVPLSTTSGAAKYYSNNNDLINNYLKADLNQLPKADGFVSSQVIYTNDNTGRIAIQSGVGENFSINPALSSERKLTRYFYGSPSTTELQRMFGVNIGLTKHYQKNLVVDPNGQSSISYVDMKGKTIATCLSGPSPDNLEELNSNNLSTESVSLDKNNTIDIDNLISKNNSVILNTVPNNAYTFNYDVNGVYNSNVINNTSYCKACIYELEIEIYDPNGNKVQLIDNTSNSGIYTLLNNNTKLISEIKPTQTQGCPQNYIYPNINFGCTFIELGNYSIHKNLKLKEGIIDDILFGEDKESTSDDFSGLPELEQISPNLFYGLSCCQISCLQTLGLREIPTDAGDLLTEYTNCVATCQSMSEPNLDYEEVAKGECEGLLNSIKLQVRPRGHFFEDDNFFNTVLSGLQTSNWIINQGTTNERNYSALATLLSSAQNITDKRRIIAEKFDNDLELYFATYHREYKHYEVCKQLIPSSAYSYEMGQMKDGWIAAKQKGYLSSPTPYQLDRFGEPYGTLSDPIIDIISNFRTQLTTKLYSTATNYTNIPIWSVVNPYACKYANNPSPWKTMINAFYNKKYLSSVIPNTDPMYQLWDDVNTTNPDPTKLDILNKEMWTRYLALYTFRKTELITQWKETLDGFVYYDDEYAIDAKPVLSQNPTTSTQQVNTMSTDICEDACTSNARFWLAKMAEKCNNLDVALTTYVFEYENGITNHSTAYNNISNLISMIADKCADGCGIQSGNPLAFMSEQQVDELFDNPAFTSALGNYCTDLNLFTYQDIFYSGYDYQYTQIEQCNDNYDCLNELLYYIKDNYDGVNPISLDNDDIISLNLAGCLNKNISNIVIDEDAITLTILNTSVTPNTTCDIIIKFRNKNDIWVNVPNSISSTSNVSLPINMTNSPMFNGENYQYSGIKVVGASINLNPLRFAFDNTSNSFVGGNNEPNWILEYTDSLNIDDSIISNEISLDTINFLTYYSNIQGWQYDEYEGYTAQFHTDKNTLYQVFTEFSDSILLLKYYYYINNNTNNKNYGSKYGINKDLSSVELQISNGENNGNNISLLCPYDISITFDKCGCNLSKCFLEWKRCLNPDIDCGPSPPRYVCWKENLSGTYDVNYFNEIPSGYCNSSSGSGSPQTPQGNSPQPIYVYIHVPEGCKSPFKSCNTVNIASGLSCEQPLDCPDPVPLEIGESYLEGLPCGSCPNIIKVLDVNQECRNNAIAQLQLQAQQEYDEQIIAIKTELLQTVNKCFDGLKENFKFTASVGNHHYTLYYYDQAGNLVQTVPPEGVKLLDNSNFDNNYNLIIDYDDQGNPIGPFPQHSLQTTYQYNSRNQVISQHTPDALDTKFWYNKKGQLRFSQNAKQATPDLSGYYRYSFTNYDAQGRIILVGEYKTTQNWNAFTQNAEYYSIDFPYDVNDNILNCSQITQTVYDKKQLNYTGLPERENLRSRVSETYYFDSKSDFDNNNFRASIFNYDEVGNVKDIYQVIAPNSSVYRINTVSYDYDLVSGKVNRVDLYKGIPTNTNKSVFYHRYNYDADNRISEVFTSRDGIIEDCDARYFYYPHGPLARVELGHDEVQGIDYAYTLQGWLKYMNKPITASVGTPNYFDKLHTLTGKNDYAVMLGYYQNDYKSLSNNTFTDYIHTGFTSTSSNDIKDAGVNLYNGNIAFMTTTIAKSIDEMLNNIQEPVINKPYLNEQTMAYRYDQLNRLQYTKTFGFAANATNISYNGYFNENYTYDANGNINTLERYALKNNNGVFSKQLMDNISYSYNKDFISNKLLNNQLAKINDNAPNLFENDIKNVGDHVYTYDEIGNLTSDEKEDIENIKWNVYGKISEIKYTATSSKNDLEFLYDATGNRIAKISKPKNQSPNQYKYTWYVRDAQGNILLTEVNEPSTNNPSTQHIVDEYSIYGSSRIGVYKSDNEQQLAHNYGQYNRSLDKKSYELTNHLGNVLEVVSDLPVGMEGATANNTVDYYTPMVNVAQDYYPFGMLMPGRYVEKQTCISTTLLLEDKFDACDENNPQSNCTQWYNSFRGGISPLLTTFLGTLVHDANDQSMRINVNDALKNIISESNVPYIGIAVREIPVEVGNQYKINTDVINFTANTNGDNSRTGAVIIVDKQQLRTTTLDDLFSSYNNNNNKNPQLFYDTTHLSMYYQATTDTAIMVVGFVSADSNDYMKIDNFTVSKFDTTQFNAVYNNNFEGNAEGWYSEFPNAEIALFGASYNTNQDNDVLFKNMGTHTVSNGKLNITDLEQIEPGVNFGVAAHDFIFNPGQTYRFKTDFSANSTNAYCYLMAIPKNAPLNGEGNLNIISNSVSAGSGIKELIFTPQDSNITIFVLYAGENDFSIDNVIVEKQIPLDTPVINNIMNMDFSQNPQNIIYNSFTTTPNNNTIYLGNSIWQSNDENLKLTFNSYSPETGLITDFATEPGKKYTVAFDLIDVVPTFQGTVWCMNNNLSTEPSNNQTNVINYYNFDSSGHNEFTFTATTNHSSFVLTLNHSGDNTNYYFLLDNFTVNNIEDVEYTDTAYHNLFNAETDATDWRNIIVPPVSTSNEYGYNQVGKVVWQETSQDIKIIDRPTSSNNNNDDIPPFIGFAQKDINVQAGVPYLLKYHIKEIAQNANYYGIVQILNKEAVEAYNFSVYNMESGVLATQMFADTGEYALQFISPVNQTLVIQISHASEAQGDMVVDNVGVYTNNLVTVDTQQFVDDITPWRSNVLTETDNPPLVPGSIVWEADSQRLKVTQGDMDIDGQNVWLGAAARKIAVQENTEYRFTIDLLKDLQNSVETSNFTDAVINVYNAQDFQKNGPMATQPIVQIPVNDYGTIHSGNFRSQDDDIVVLVYIKSGKTQQQQAGVFYIDNLKVELVESSITYTCENSTPETHIGNNYRFGFNGQEKDDEVKGTGNHYEFKFREYDPRTGKFWSVDPLFKKYPWNSSYAFAENRVIDGIDLEGLEHYYTGDGKLIGKYGTSTEIRIVDKSEVKKATNYFKEYTANPTAFDKTKKAKYLSTTLLNDENSRPVFTNTDDAAIHWAGINNRKSIEANREYGSTMYKLTIDGTTYVVYTEAKKGGKAGVTNDDAPTGTSTEVADIHSHGKYLPKYKNNEFSSADKSGSDELGYPGYLSTPNGTLQKYDPATKTESTLKTDIPSDKKDPTRKNTID